MKAVKQGAWKKAAQSFAEKQARKTARGIWSLYWKKHDRQHAKPKR